MPRKKSKVNDVTTSAPRTTLQKLEAARALVAKYEQQLASEAIVNNIEVGDDVDFIFGRGDKKRTLTGVVIVGITELDGVGKVVGVESGEGFEKQVYKVRVSDLSANRTADGREPTIPTTSDESDPLSAE
jgi:hypothetical protein